MQKELLEKSFDFSVRLVELVKYLKDEKKAFPLSGRLLLCGNNIGTSLRKAGTASKDEYARCLGEAAENAAECAYMLELMAKTVYLSEPQSKPLHEDCDRLINLIAAERVRTEF